MTTKQEEITVEAPPDRQPLTPRGHRKRAAIVNAARAVFEENGFRDARVADITTRAGASYGSFYTYFESKEGVFREVVEEVAEHMFEASRLGRQGNDAFERIEEATRRYLDAYRKSAAILAVLEEVAPHNVEFSDLRLRIRALFLKRNASGIRRLQKSGEADVRLDAELAGNALGAMVERIAYLWFVLGEPFDEEATIATLTQLWAGALGLVTP
jgi:AcrR family transcriptional regulator